MHAHNTHMQHTPTYTDTYIHTQTHSTQTHSQMCIHYTSSDWAQ